MAEVKEEIKEILNQTEQSEKEEQNAEDSKKIEEVFLGRQEVFIQEYGSIIFELPNAGMALEGDRVVAKFKTEHLRKGDLLTDAELKAIHNKPVVIKQDDQDITIGSGEWTDKQEREMEDLPDEIQGSWEMFVAYREEYQQIKQQMLELTNSKEDKTKKKQLGIKFNKVQKSALAQHDIVLNQKAHLLELQSTRVRLFSDSLEEQAFFEKIKLYAPSCIKIERDGKEDFLWKSEDEMLGAKFAATRIITLFNLFVRGLDVRFFGDAPEEATSS